MTTATDQQLKAEEPRLSLLERSLRTLCTAIVDGFTVRLPTSGQNDSATELNVTMYPHDGRTVVEEFSSKGKAA